MTLQQSGGTFQLVGQCRQTRDLGMRRGQFVGHENAQAVLDRAALATLPRDHEISGLVQRTAELLCAGDEGKTFEGPIIEVHISNIHARDEHHRHSKLSSAVKAVICGLGPYGYIVAVQAAAHMLGALPAGFPKPLRAEFGGAAKR